MRGKPSMYNSGEMRRPYLDSDEDTEDASESEMPKYEYDNYSPPLNHQHHQSLHHQSYHQSPHLTHLPQKYQQRQQQQIAYLHPSQQKPFNPQHQPQHLAHNNTNYMNCHQNPSDNGNSNFTELREQMYLDKLNNLREQLYQLDAGMHPEFIRQLKKVEVQRQDRLLLNDAFQLYETERVEREYINEKKAALREFEDRKIELRESLISELEDRRRMIENERSTMELLSDCVDPKPVTTRKLRRRPNEPIPVPDKRRRTSPAQLNHQLEDKEIQEDLKALQKALQSQNNAGGKKQPKASLD